MQYNYCRFPRDVPLIKFDKLEIIKSQLSWGDEAVKLNVLLTNVTRRCRKVNLSILSFVG